MSELVLPIDQHNRLVDAAYRSRGFTAEEAEAAAGLCALASRHGIKTHNAIKALHLDEHFGSGAEGFRGCVPGATIEKRGGKFKGCDVWNANHKLGQAVAFEAVDRCIELADEFGVGTVSVDRAFHYLWGGGYVMDAARRGYIAYTHCTATLTEVVPFGGKFPTLGTNPHSWALPTVDAVGFAIVVDWATSTIAMGRVQQLAREGKALPPDAAVDAEGRPTTDPSKVNALLPFGAHKGYGLSLLNELFAAYIGGSKPTLRYRPDRAPKDEKLTSSFFFQVIHPEALSSGDFAQGRDQSANLKAVIEDVLGHGNASCMLPGQIEHEAAKRSEKAGGLLFTPAEIDEFKKLADSLGEPFDPGTLNSA